LPAAVVYITVAAIIVILQAALPRYSRLAMTVRAKYKSPSDLLRDGPARLVSRS
jgi:hypothetical protein